MLRFLICVNAAQDGLTLRTLLKRELRFSTAMVQKLKATDAVRTEGRVLRVHERIARGMSIEILLPVEERTDAPVEEGPLTVLYEDAALLAVEKPPGMLVHPSLKQHHGTLISRALSHIAKHGEPPVLHPLHRLDRDTSGIVVFAKHAHVQGHWMAQLQAGQVEKIYLGLVLGRMPDEAGEIGLPIGRAPGSYLTRRVDPAGLPARTEYRVRQVLPLTGQEVVSLVELRPVTGRTHQLRLHCLAVGAPLVGDTQYETPASHALGEQWGLSGQLLHAWRLSFLHPFTGERLGIECPMMRLEPMLARCETSGHPPGS